MTLQHPAPCAYAKATRTLVFVLMSLILLMAGLATAGWVHAEQATARVAAMERDISWIRETLSRMDQKLDGSKYPSWPERKDQ